MKKLTLFLVALAMILVSCKPEIEKPTVVTKSVGEVTETTAKVVGQVTADGGAEISERGVCWNAEGNPTILDFRTIDGIGVGSFTSNIPDLVPNTQYYVRAYATNEAGTSYGEEKTFTTLEVIPEEPGDEPEEPGDEPEEPGDEPEEPGDEPEEPGDEPEEPGDEPEEPGDEPEEPGDEPEEPGDEPEEPGDEPEEPGDEPEEPGNGDGDENEDPETPVDPEQPVGPVVITAEVTDITITSAVCGGEVVSGGDAVVVVRGVCWNTSGQPTVSDTYTMDGINIGNFTSSLSNLESNTTYYVRAYATNAQGVTAYGKEVSFTTKDVPAVAVDLGLSVKWATCNVGATTPEEYGDYFAWGETTTKETYKEDNSLTYGLSNSELQSQGYIDSEGNLTPQYDAATANWGGTWRMPTYEELKELRTNCTWTIATQNDVYGYNVEGPNGNSIFLPIVVGGGRGYYWSSTPNENYVGNAWGLNFGSADHDRYLIRYDGQLVRPVIE